MPEGLEAGRELTCVAFICQKCGAQASGFTFYGAGWHTDHGHGGRYLVRCHNQQVTVLADIPATATPAQPLVVNVFTDVQKQKKQIVSPPTNTNAPNVRFYCGKCDHTSSEFSYQRETSQLDDMKAKHAFIVTCRGQNCQGHRHKVIYDGKDLHDRKAWTTTVPLLLPIDVSQIGKVSYRPAATPTAADPQLRKMRLQE
jgi:hypothetical protein